MFAHTEQWRKVSLSEWAVQEFAQECSAASIKIALWDSAESQESIALQNTENQLISNL